MSTDQFSRPEIKITPEMIEAGLGPLLRFSRERDIYEDAVCEIYRAMACLRPKCHQDDEQKSNMGEGEA